MLKYTDLSLLVFSLQGIENIRNEIQDTLEPLIDPVHGHGRYNNTSLHLLSTSVWLLQQIKCYSGFDLCGKVSFIYFRIPHILYWCFFLICFCSQSLVNLLVTGHAVSNVWDGDRECSGMSKTSIKFLHIRTNMPYSHASARAQFCGPEFKLHPSVGSNSYIPQPCTKGTN